MRYLSVKSWDKYQHYKDRDPPWIKLYRDTFTTESWVLGTDLSRLLQLASTMLAARYSNKIPLNFTLLKRVVTLDCKESEFLAAINHLIENDFLEIHEVEDDRKQSASTLLATCSSEERRGEKSRAEESRGEQISVPQGGTSVGGEDPIMKVFAHWAQCWNHPKSKLDKKRREVIRRALDSYSEADLCQSISGYLNSPHHTGRNERATVYDDIELFLRDAKHIDAGLRFYAQPPETNLSAKTRQIIDQTEGWVPPELRNAVN